MKVRAIYKILFTISLISIACSGLAAKDFYASKHSEYPEYPQIDYGTGKQAAELKRGEYLTKLGDCIACHTAKDGQPFAGNYPIKTPFGTIYTANITADKKTGIGGWTDEQFIKAMREGISPTGSCYFPAFPYLFFNRITDADLKSIKLYLDTIPKVSLEKKPNTMRWPFSMRFMQLGWRSLFFTMDKDGPYKNDPKHSAAWNRGAYLVEGLGHCSMCHTPSYYIFSRNYSLAAPKKKYYLAGNTVEGFYAPNITGKLMDKATNKEIADVFKQDKLIGGGQVQGPMLQANHDSLKYLTPEDVDAIAIYLRSVKSQSPPRQSHGSGLAAGKSVYSQYCTGCHATGAGGAPKVGDVTVWEPRVKLGMPTLYTNAIKGIGGMPPKGTCMTCTDKEIEDAVNYMVAESKPGVGTASAPAAKPVKQLTLKDGKKLYNQYCAVCHNPGSQYLNAPKLGDKEAWKPILKQGFDIVFYNTIRGHGNMPIRGGCVKCNDAQIKAAVKYMAETSKTTGDYTLW